MISSRLILTMLLYCVFDAAVAQTPAPTKRPTVKPTRDPTSNPTKPPTRSPTKRPTPSPTKRPTLAPTRVPTASPTTSPTKRPTLAPTKRPTVGPTIPPTPRPTSPPVIPTFEPTMAPVPTFAPFTSIFDPFIQPVERVVPEPLTFAPTEIEFVDDNDNIIMPPPVDAVLPPNFIDGDRVDIIVPTKDPTPAPQAAAIANLILGDVPAVPRTNDALPTPSTIAYLGKNLRRPSSGNKLSSF